MMEGSRSINSTRSLLPSFKTTSCCRATDRPHLAGVKICFFRVFVIFLCPRVMKSSDWLTLSLSRFVNFFVLTGFFCCSYGFFVNYLLLLLPSFILSEFQQVFFWDFHHGFRFLILDFGSNSLVAAFLAQFQTTAASAGFRFLILVIILSLPFSAISNNGSSESIFFL